MVHKNVQCLGIIQIYSSSLLAEYNSQDNLNIKKIPVLEKSYTNGLCVDVFVQVVTPLVLLSAVSETV